MNEKGYTLYVVEGDLVRKFNTTEFQKNELTIGSGGADILVESNSISGIHLRINTRNDKLYFADMDSAEGSYVYNNTEFSKLESMKYYKKAGQDTVIRLGTTVLVIIADNKGESEYLKANIEKGISIGRSRENDIVLNHFGISLRHAQILPAEKGNIDMLYVYGKKRTFVNGQEVENEQVLRNCDYIQILGFTLIYFNNFVIYKKVFDGANMELHHLVKGGGIGKKELDNVSLRIDSNEFTAVVGDNGSLINVMRGSAYRLKSGEVYLNGLDLLNHIDMLKETVGYVPREDILYEELTVGKSMKYAMKLKDYDEAEDKFLDRRIDSVLDMLGIIGFIDEKPNELDKDIKKRADIAMELLGNPSLLILDEPTAGFDEETERGMLYLLRDMARMESKTVIISTNRIRKLELFDKIIFMGTGGKICFSGTLNEAKMFFDTESVTDILNMIKENPNEWAEQYQAYFSFNETPRTRQRTKLKPKISYRKQFGLLLKRSSEILFKSRIARLILTLIQPIVFGGIPYLIKDSEWAMFALSLFAVWLGIFNSIGEICKERVIFLREHSGNLKIPLYLSSKYVIQLITAFVQSLLMTATLSAVGFPQIKTLIVSDIFLDIWLKLLIMILVSASVGILISALLKKRSQATFTAPILFIAGGILLKLFSFTESYLYVLLPITLVFALFTLLILKSTSKTDQ